MSKQLDGKKIVIIGGSTGLGLSAATAFMVEGAKVVIVGNDDNEVQAAASKLGKDSFGFVADAKESETAAQAIDTCVDRFGGFDGLYHVAGGSGRRLGDGPLHELTREGWEKTIEWNLTSLMWSNQAAVRKFLETGLGGSILNISSVLAFSPSPKHFATHAYAAAKSAVIGFSKSVASYYAKDNIRVNVMAPALVETPMSKRAVGDESIRAFIHAKQPLDGGRVGEPADLDGLAIFFMSDASRFTTAQVIAVDGGWSVSEGMG